MCVCFCVSDLGHSSRNWHRAPQKDSRFVMLEELGDSCFKELMVFTLSANVKSFLRTRHTRLLHFTV